MVMEDSFTQMVTIISAIGQMARDPATENWLIDQVEYTKDSGSSLSLWVINELLIFQFFYLP